MGWYTNATVFRTQQTTPDSPLRKVPDGRPGLCYWSITTSERDSHLIADPDARIFRLPDWVVSQSLFTYLDAETARANKLREDLLALIDGTWVPGNRKAGHGGKSALDTIVKVERAAVSTAIEHFESQKYEITSVEPDCVGWDLEGRIGGKLVLRIEVKGCRGSKVTAELTPNEYLQSKQKKDSYRICIVTDALAVPKLHVFSWSVDHNAWRCTDGRSLQIVERMSAVVKVR